MKLDSDTKEIMTRLIRDKIFIRRNKSIDISAFLEDDRKLNLWELESCIRACARFLNHINSNYRLTLGGTVEYCEIRNIPVGSKQFIEELEFIIHFMRVIVDDEIS